MNRPILPSIFLFASLVVLIGCNVTAISLPTLTPAPTIPEWQAANTSVFATLNAAPTRTPALETPTIPSIAATYTARAATVAATTPTPKSIGSQIISSQTVSRLQELARWGDSYITQIAWSPTGDRLAISSRFGVRVYEMGTRQELWSVESRDEMTSAAFSPDGKWLVAGSYKTIKLYSASNGAEVRSLIGHNDWVIKVAFSVTGTMIASASYDKTIKIWDYETGREIRTLSGHSDQVLSLVFSLDGLTLASASSDKSVKLWDVASGNEKRAFQVYSPVVDVLLSPDGRLAWALERSTIHTWEITSGKEITILNAPARNPARIALSLHGTFLASGDSAGVDLWDAVTGNRLRTLRTLPEGVAHYGTRSSMAFSPDEKILASIDFDQNVKFWDTSNGTELAPLGRQTFKGYSVALSSDARVLALGTMDGTIKLMDTATGKYSRLLSGHQGVVTSLAFSPLGTILASGSVDKHVKLWDLNSGLELRDLVGHNILVSSVAFSADGKTLLSASNNAFEGLAVKLWEVNSGRELLNHLELGRRGNGFALSPNGKTFATGAFDGTIKLWNVDEDSVLVTITGAGSIKYLTFSPDGSVLASLGQSAREVKLWQVPNGKNYSNLSGYASDVMSITFSSDGKLLVSASADGTLTFWDIPNQRVLRKIAAPDREMTSVLFSRDGRLLVTSSPDQAGIAFGSNGATTLFVTSGNSLIRSWGLSPEFEASMGRAQVALEASSKWRAVLTDAFQSNVNRWPSGEFSNNSLSGTRTFMNGKYRWEGKGPQNVIWRSQSIANPLSDFYLSTTGKWISGARNTAYGLIFRRESDDSHYFFGMTDSQQFALRLLSSNSWSTLIDWTYTTAIRPGDTNRLTVIAEGSHFLLFINNQYVGEASDDKLGNGRVGVAIQFFNPNDQVVVEFDDFELRAP